MPLRDCNCSCERSFGEEALVRDAVAPRCGPSGAAPRAKQRRALGGTIAQLPFPTLRGDNPARSKKEECAEPRRE